MSALGSNIDVKGCVRIVQQGDDKRVAEALIDALKYTTRHFNDNTTPKNIKTLLTYQTKEITY